MPSLLALALALAPADLVEVPATTVELRVTSVDEGEAKLLEQALLREIGDRLLEDGHRLVPPGASAGVRVWIHLGRDEATIEARGVEPQRQRVPGAEPHVMALELQQLTTALVDEVRPSVGEPVRAVSVEIIGEPADPELRARLQVGLLERGHALTLRPERDDLRVCVVVEDSRVFVHAVMGLDACARDPAATPIPAADRVEVVRELLLDAASASVEGRELVRAEPAIDAPAEAARPAPPERDDGEVEPEVEPEPANPRQPSVSVGASGGVLGRGGGVDPMLSIEARGGRRRGLGGGLGLALVPSRADELRVIEYLPTASLDWRLGFAGRGLAVLGAFAGAHVHAYSYVDARERGVRIGPSVGASARLAYLGPRGALLFGGVRAGWSGGRWVHVADGQAIWGRAGVVVGVELGAGWDFNVGRRRDRAGEGVRGGRG